jgi:hypothetical protein
MMSSPHRFFAGDFGWRHKPQRRRRLKMLSEDYFTLQDAGMQRGKLKMLWITAESIGTYSVHTHYRMVPRHQRQGGARGY